MEVEDESESCKKLDEQKKKLQKEPTRNAGEHQGVTAAPVARVGEKEA